MNKTYDIAEQNLSSLYARLNKLNVRLVKIGAQPFTFAVTERKNVADPKNPAFMYQVATVSLEIPTPAVNEWSFQATIVHTAEGNIVRALPGVEVPPVHRDGAPHCDHCQTNRLRRDTYIVRNTAGETKQVGSTCLGEFLGHKTPHLVCAALDYSFEAVDACDKASTTPAVITTYRIPTLTYLEYVAMAVFKANRFVTRKTAREQQVDSTADQAMYWMMHGGDAVGGVVWQEPTPEAKAFARTALDFVLNKFAPALPTEADPASFRDALLAQFSVREDLSDFEHNLLSVARAEAIEPRLCGIAAYIIEYYRREQKVVAQPVQLHGGFNRIFSIFETAAKNLKRPAIQLVDAENHPISLSLAGTTSRNAGYIYVKGGRGGDYYGKISPEGRFFGNAACPPAVEAHLKSFGDSPEDVASRYGKLTGRCCFCGLPLRDERSTEVGYGPVCADHFGLSWGSHKAAEATAAVA